MTGLGEKFSDKDIDDMIRVADKSGSGKVRSFCCFFSLEPKNSTHLQVSFQDFESVLIE